MALEIDIRGMLPKENRITKKKEFERIFKKGTGFKEGLLLLRVMPNDSGISRFAFIAGLKVSKNATVRNKIKRQLRELTKLQMNNFKKGIDAVLIALPGLEKKEFSEIAIIFNNLFKKAKLL